MEHPPATGRRTSASAREEDDSSSSAHRKATGFRYPQCFGQIKRKAKTDAEERRRRRSGAALIRCGNRSKLSIYGGWAEHPSATGRRTGSSSEDEDEDDEEDTLIAIQMKTNLSSSSLIPFLLFSLESHENPLFPRLPTNKKKCKNG